MSGKRRGITTVETPFGKIEAEEMDFKNVSNEPVVVKVEDGTTVKVRLFVIKVSRGIDPKTKGALLLPTGEPMYQLSWTIGITSDTPPEVMERFKKGSR